MIHALALGCQNLAFVGGAIEVVSVEFTPFLVSHIILVMLDRQSRGGCSCIHSTIVLGLHVNKSDFRCQIVCRYRLRTRES